jgi:hypothetical protein
VRLDGALEREDGLVARATVRADFFRGSASVRLHLRIRNPRRALHEGGFWELGDPGSIFLRDLSLVVDTRTPVESVECWPESNDARLTVSAPFSIYQDSSGGRNWRSAVHVNRKGLIPLRFRGYQLRSQQFSADGLRAEPVVSARHAGGSTTVCLKHFWQNFPKAISVETREARIELFPSQFEDLHELQGGEQKTHTIGIAFAPDSVSEVPLDWIRRPLTVSTSPEWYAFAEAIPFLTVAGKDTDPDYQRLVSAAVDGSDTFVHKREFIDEYGWRHFGDIYADHENVYNTDSTPFVSHYNNQYDAIAGMTTQFMRTGDPRWWRTACELAEHVIDIDLYHCSTDKAAYNGGYFWHTFHYRDAGKSTHRAYSRQPGISGGGPSDEHDYSTGLMLNYFLTGNPASKEAVAQLGRWVLDMDDGRLSVFKWLSRASTGLASSTAEPGYHGPGRGPGNSITTLLNAYRLTQSDVFLEKAEQLIRRCIHPSDPVEQRGLLNPELRWSYVVFLQVLGRYVHEKLSRNQIDRMCAYATASLLSYASWMAEHEYPYLDKRQLLEYPTETWAAQDVRKSEVFAFAALYSAGSRRERFLERSEFFFRTSMNRLRDSATRTLARPVVLLLSNGFTHDYFHRRTLPPAPVMPAFDHGVPTQFVPQKQKVLTRASALVLGLPIAAVLLGILYFWFR